MRNIWVIGVKLEMKMTEIRVILQGRFQIVG